MRGKLDGFSPGCLFRFLNAMGRDVEILSQAKTRELPSAEVTFNYGEHEGKITALEPLFGNSGWFNLSLFTVDSLEHSEDHLLFSALTDAGMLLDEEAARRLLTLPAYIGSPVSPPAEMCEGLENAGNRRREAIQRSISERNARFFEAEADKLDGWADDLKICLAREIKDLDRQIKEARRSAKAAPTLEEKLVGQKQLRALESKRSQMRKEFFEAQDAIDAKREELIGNIEKQLKHASTAKPLFTILWRLR